MIRSLYLPLLFVAVVAAGCADGNSSSDMVDDEALAARAVELAQEFIIVDTHIDVPYRMTEKWDDVSEATEDGDFDYPRAIAGGLNAPFMSVYIPAEKQETPGAPSAFADSLIDMMEGIVANAPDKFAIAVSPSDVRAQYSADGMVSLPMGMENGAPIEDLGKLQHFFDRGIRYITLTHGKVNLISDSSYDTTRTWNGLSPYGEQVVAGMNNLGIMVDISHVSDSAFYDALAITTAPMIASHSSARHFTPGFERNMSDDMIVALAENGGVIQINYGSSFLTKIYNEGASAWRAATSAYRDENGIEEDSEEDEAYKAEYLAEHPRVYADLTDVVDHIDHVVALTGGVDHVGIGSDYDGVGDSLPTGLKDVSSYPNLIHELLKRGYAESDIQKIVGGNLLRVWDEVERVAAELQAGA